MIGTQIGNLKIIREIGSGGMAKVYLAEQLLLNDLQAVKVLNPALTNNPQVVQRFINEGRAAVKLRHPNLVPVYSVDQLPDGGPWYLVMQYLEGGTLARFMESMGGPLSVHETLHIILPIIGCTQWIHDRNVVHRDLKPENLFLVQRDNDPHWPVMLDLGVAQVSDAIAPGPGTKEGTLIGTPVYMAPEQIRGERVTALADIFALGIIVYQMSTGGWFPWQRSHETRAQYVGLSAAELYLRQMSAPPVDPRHRFAGMTDAWARALMRIVQPDLRQRPQSAREVALLLAENVQADAFHPAGLTILEKRAPDLLHTPYNFNTVQSPAQPVAIESGPARQKRRYQLGEKLGSGGMAEVYEGTQLGAAGFSRRVAIKRVLPGLSEVPAFRNMFIAEAQIAARLNHSNVVSVHDFDRDEDGRLYLVMEYVHGKDLATLLDAGPIEPPLIIYIVVEMLRGLGYAHAPEPDREGIVHRDVSPQNVLLSYEGAVKISDCGIAKALDASGNAYSATVRGKPAYMSPEQCNGDPLDRRSDLFAVGTMLYEMLTHKPLFTGIVKEIIARITWMPIPLPSTVRKVPKDLEAIVMKLMARNPEDRYPNAEAVIDDLLQCENAPKNGLGALVEILARRFPQKALRTRIGDSGMPDTSKPEPRITTRIATSTLSGTASQAIKRDHARRRRPMRPMRFLRRHRGISAVLGSILLIATVALVLVFPHGSIEKRDPGQTTPAHSTEPVAYQPAPAAQPVGSAAHAPELVAHLPEPTAHPSELVAHPPVPATRSPEAAASPPEPATRPPEPTTRPMLPSPRAATPTTSAPTDVAAASPVARTDVAASPFKQASAPAQEGGTPPQKTPESAKRGEGQLVIAVRPWALIEIDGVDRGQTPFDEQIAAGRHRIRIRNPDLGIDETHWVMVSPGAPAKLQRMW